MERIHEKVWIYCGHEIAGAESRRLLRGADRPPADDHGARPDGKVHVLYNRCPHRGYMLVGDLKGNTGERFRCSYHAWSSISTAS